MDNAPEKQQDNSQGKAVETERAIEQLREVVRNQLRGIEASDATPEQKDQQRSELATRYLQDAANQSNRLKEAQEVVQQKGETSQAEKNQKEAAKEIHRSLIKAAEVVKEIKNPNKGQVLLSQIVEASISESAAVNIGKSLGEYLRGEKEIILSSEGQEKTNFQKDFDLLKSKDPEAAKSVLNALEKKASVFGKKEGEIREIFDQRPVSSDQERAQQLLDAQKLQEIGAGDIEGREIFSKFTGEQRKFLAVLDSPETFKGNIDFLFKGEREKETQDHKYREKILRAYNKLGQTAPIENSLADLIEREIRIEVSEHIGKKLGDILNQLYYRIQIERPDKFFEEIEQEDFIRGILAVKNAIVIKIERLYNTLREIEESGSKEEKDKYKIKLVRHAEEAHTVEEINKEGKKVPSLRMSPLPYFEDIGLSEFVQSMEINFNHWQHRSSYLHNGRALFNHPAHGDKGFYSTLAGYAEKLSGVDVDEMMLLPDGGLIGEAFNLYEKFVMEEFASQDWTHRTDQFTNQLERVNTQLESEVIAMLKKLYPNESRDRIQYAVNAAVGIARAVFLTEPEKSSYADPLDIERSKGLFASYSTNDATSLQVFNPLHVGLRWQGEHLWPMFYFMPMEKTGRIWDHSKMFNNMAKYMDSFVKGRSDLPDDLFVDRLININKVGGLLFRKGWRMTYSLSGHMERNEDGTLSYLETFKAMDLIGFEAINDFLKTKVDIPKFGKKGEEAETSKITDLFKYIFERYFKPFGEADYNSYMSGLQKQAKAELVKDVANGLSLGDDYNAAVEKKAAELFINNALAHEVALRFPSIFLRIDRSRFQKEGVSRWQEIQQEMGLSREKFDEVMKDFNFVEMLLRREISAYAKESSHLFRNLRLNSFNKFEYEINENTIKRLLEGLNKQGEEKKFSGDQIDKVITLYKKMKGKYLNSEFLDSSGFKAIGKYPFTFGLEETDFTLMAIRGTGPRAIARTIADTGMIESVISPWIIEMPRILNKIAIDGKHDFSEIIDFLRKAQKAITMVHGTGHDYEFVYNISSAVINYFKKDTAAKPLFGLFRLGKENSMAAKYAGRSTAVWEWDSRDIDRYCIALESFRLLPKNAYDLQKIEEGKYVGGQPEDRWIKLPGMKKPIKFGKQRHIDHKWNSAKLRKEHGGDLKAISFDMVNQFLPLAIAFLLWKYIKDAMDEAAGKKKQ